MTTQLHQKQRQTLFKIDIKMGQRVVTLNLTQVDTIESLLVKNKMAKSSDVQKINQLKEKIKLSIAKQIQIKLYSNQLQLANKMKLFLQKQVKKQMPTSAHTTFQKTHNSLNKKPLPFHNSFQQLFPQHSHEAQKLQNKQIQITKDDFLCQKTLTKQLQKPQRTLQEISLIKNKQANSQNFKGSALYGFKNRSNTHKQNSSVKKVSNKKIDDDLIRAYEVIWKKCKDKTMRQMAQKSLRQFNVIPEDTKISQFLAKHSSHHSFSKQSFTQNSQVNQQLTPVQKKQMFQTFQNKISDASICMKKNYRYSYLDENSQLYYPYQTKEKSRQKYSYNKLEQSYIQMLKKDYERRPNQIKIYDPPFKRRFNYLDE